MKQIFIFALFIICSLMSYAQDGQIGDKASELQIKKWMKGGPINLSEGLGKNVYVIEFWATWCPPCRRSIPHLTEIQKKYKEQGVIIVGITTEKIKPVRTFINKMGDMMDYAVAIDDNEGTSKAYMEAFGIDGIPHAFIVDKKGLIVWQGHPMDNMELVLDKVLTGTFEPGKEKFVGQLLEDANNYELESAKENNTPEAIQKAKEKFEATLIIIKDYSIAAENVAMICNNLSWHIMTEESIKSRDMEFAFNLANLANELAKGEQDYILDTFALAVFLVKGDVKQALELQQKAYNLAKENGRDLQEYEERLIKYQEALKKLEEKK